MRIIFRQLRDLLSPRDRLLFFVLLLLLVGLALLEMVGIASVMPFMAVVMNPGSIQSNHWLHSLYLWLDFDSETSFLTFIGYLVLSVLVVNNFGKAINLRVMLRYENRLATNLSRRLLASYMARPYEFFLGRNTSSLGGTLLVEATRVASGVMAPIMNITANAFVCVAILSMLIVIDPFIAVGIIIVLGGAYAAIYLLVRRKFVLIGKQQVEANIQKYTSASESLSGVKDLKVLGREPAFLSRFSRFAEVHARNNVAAGVLSQVPRYALEILAVGGILLVVLFLIRQGRQASQLIPVLALYAFAGYKLMPALQAVFAAVTNLRANAASLTVLHTDLLGPGSVNDPESLFRDAASTKPMAFNDAIELRDVSFRYAGASEISVRKLNMSIRSHTCVGIVGPTGCGKTTTVDLILGLLSPQGGKILVDGVELTEPDLPGWRKILGYVPQQIYISDDTIAKNIAFGIPDDEIDMKAVRKAASIANLNEFIETQLPDGYQTGIGERGVRLSGGQRQRIGIARAMYRDPTILIMDEATSALDGVTEESVMDAVHRLSGKKTVILIAHRLTTVKDCDVIFQLDRGAVAVSGTYDDMMRNSPWFRAAARGSDGQ